MPEPIEKTRAAGGALQRIRIPKVRTAPGEEGTQAREAMGHCDAQGSPSTAAPPKPRWAHISILVRRRLLQQERQPFDQARRVAPNQEGAKLLRKQRLHGNLRAALHSAAHLVARTWRCVGVCLCGWANVSGQMLSSSPKFGPIHDHVGKPQIKTRPEFGRARPRFCPNGPLPRQVRASFGRMQPKSHPMRLIQGQTR